MTDICNTDDVIDSRDVIARIEDLETEIADAIEAAGANWDSDESLRKCSRDTFIADHLSIAHADETEELAALQALAKEGADYAPDWEHGETLVRDSYFEEYAQELAEDIGAINADAAWPACHIDWNAAARALQMDYTAIDFAGVTYWVR